MGIHIIRLWGCSPVQAEGYIAHCPFYFRARGDRWQFAVATGWKPHRYAAMDVASGQMAGFLLTRSYGRMGSMDASAMPYAEARHIIGECATVFAQLEKEDVWQTDRLGK